MKTIRIKLSLEELLASNGDIVIEIGDNNGHLVQHSTIQASPPTETGLFAFMETVINELKSTRKPRTVETYQAALNSFRRFRNNQDLPLSAVDATVMGSYEQWLHDRNVTPNSSSFYMRILRAVYRRGVDRGLTADLLPFRKVYTGIARTTKRAVDIDVIRRLASLDLSDDTRFARDMFLFSFYTQGMAFVDMAHLKRSNIVDGLLTYYRQKTGQRVSIRWLPCMQQIVDVHHSASSAYLLPIIQGCGGTERSQYRRCQYQVNCALHELTQQLQLSQRLTLYVARHSWASIARSIGIPLDVISRGMGHNNELTTNIYLKDLDNGRQAAANQQVLSLLSSSDSSS